MRDGTGGSYGTRRKESSVDGKHLTPGSQFEEIEGHTSPSDELGEAEVCFEYLIQVEVTSLDHDPVDRAEAAALLPRLFGKNPRSHHKGTTGRVRTGDQRLPVLCRCQLGQDNRGEFYPIARDCVSVVAQHPLGYFLHPTTRIECLKQE